MTRLFFIFFATFCFAAAAFGQNWSTFITLTSDTFNNGQGRIVVDDSLRVHLLYVQVRNLSFPPPPPIVATLHYQRFDNWGNPLCPPIELLPDTDVQDYDPGLLLDRQGNIHVVWCRLHYSSPQDYASTCYARLNTQGEILTGPVEMPDQAPCWSLYAAMNLVEDSAGLIWVGQGHCFFTVDEAGNITTPITRPFQPADSSSAELLLLAAGPGNHVWATFRRGHDSQPDDICVMRLDTTVRTPEVVSANPPGPDQIYGLGPDALFIDSLGRFHYILYRDDAGLFYQRDARDGSRPDTVVFDPHPYGDGVTLLDRVADTLEYFWGRSAPQSGFHRVGFSMGGERILGPEFHLGHGFGLGDYYHMIWKRGGYWLVGGNVVDGRGQVQMIHIPGPGEPANAVPESHRSNISSFSLSASPNPFNSTVTITLALPQHTNVKLDIFNLLGERVSTLVEKPLTAGTHEFQWNAKAASSGVYFYRVSAGSQVETRKILLLK